MDDVEKLNIDSIIARLLEVRNSKPGKNVQLAENEIRGLCLKSRELFLSQPILLELEAPLKICGRTPFSLSSLYLSLPLPLSLSYIKVTSTDNTMIY